MVFGGKWVRGWLQCGLGFSFVKLIKANCARGLGFQHKVCPFLTPYRDTKGCINLISLKKSSYWITTMSRIARHLYSHSRGNESQIIAWSLTLKALSAVSGVARAFPASPTLLTTAAWLLRRLYLQHWGENNHLEQFTLYFTSYGRHCPSPPRHATHPQCCRRKAAAVAKLTSPVAHVFTISKRLGNLKCAFGVWKEDESFTHRGSQVFQLNVTFVGQQCLSRPRSCPWRWVMSRRMRTATSWWVPTLLSI